LEDANCDLQFYTLKKMRGEEVSTIPYEMVAAKIYLIRGQKVMLDRDPAALYRVETKRLKEALDTNCPNLFVVSSVIFQLWLKHLRTGELYARSKLM
jgi:hypothetical protein